jgi:glycosyltransferase involved in cell wall biosynthesis
MRIALLTNDNREIQRKYHLDRPIWGPAPEALLEGFMLMPSQVEVHVVSCLQRLPIESPKKLAKNVYFHPLHVPNIGWLKTGYLGCVSAVRRKLRQIQPDIVHGQGTERDCAMSAVFSGLPNILTIHGHMSRIAQMTKARPLSYYWISERLEALCLGRTGGVLCLNSYTARKIGPLARQRWIVPNAVDPSFFDVVRREEDPARVLCAANINTWKNQIGLIKALDSLDLSPPFQLIFAGAGSPLHPYFREFQDVVSKRPWCQYLGALDRNSLKVEMSRATIGVLPSFEDNCPMVVLEAAAANLPFAASAIGGIPDLIVHGDNGLLFSPNKPEEIRDSIGFLLEHSQARQKLAACARRKAEANFHPRAVASEHIRIYEQLITSHESN